MKKLLALVLALVMTLGLATVGANAAATKYTDADKINYKEAVDVMSAIGVLGGKDAGNYDPAGNLKRSEGAKIVAYLYGGNKVAEGLQGTGSKFSDVPANHWAAGYIEYLASLGVIGGVGDGKFDPDGTLTTAQFAKMLLVTLGYKADVENLGGSDWMINTQRLANNNQNNLFKGNDNAVATAAITREEAALYAFNTLKAPIVEYDNNVRVDNGNGSIVTVGNNTAKIKVNNSVAKQTIYNKTDLNGGYIDEFAEEYYPKLKLIETTDGFGRKANNWNYDGTDLGKFTDTSDMILHSGDKVTKATMYNLIGSAIIDRAEKKTDKVGSRVSVEFYSNGKPLYFDTKNTDFALSTFFEKNSTSAIGFSATQGQGLLQSGNGILTEVYKTTDDDGDITIKIVMIATYIVKATADFNTSKNELSIEAPQMAQNTKDTTLYPSMDTKIDGEKFDVKDIKTDDYLLVTWSESDKEFKDVDKAEMLIGKVSQYTTKDNVIIDGNTYKYNKLLGDAEADHESGVLYTINENAKVVLDKYGYVIYVDEAISTSAYVFVAGYDVPANGLVGSSVKFDTYYLDGKHTVVEIEKVNGKSLKTYTGQTTDAAAATAVSYNWYTYTNDGTGKIKLSAISDTKLTSLSPAGTGAEQNFIKADRANFVVSGTTTKDADGSAATVSGTASTKFVIRDSKGDVTTYVGISKMADVKIDKTAAAGIAKNIASTGVEVYSTVNSNNFAKLVFVDAYNAKASVDGANDASYMYILKADDTKTTYLDGTSYLKYKVIYDGKEDEKFIDSALGVKAGDLLRNIKVNSKGYVDGYSDFDDSAKRDLGSLTSFAQSGTTVRLSGVDYITTDSTKIYLTVFKGVSELLKDSGADYETHVLVSANYVNGMLKDRTLKGTYYVVTTDDNNTKAATIYLSVTGASAASKTGSTYAGDWVVTLDNNTYPTNATVKHTGAQDSAKEIDAIVAKLTDLGFTLKEISSPATGRYAIEVTKGNLTQTVNYRPAADFQQSYVITKDTKAVDMPAGTIAGDLIVQGDATALTANTTVNGEVFVESGATLDLGGKTLTISAKDALTNNGTVKNGTIVAAGDGLTIAEDGTFDGVTTAEDVTIASGTSVTFKAASLAKVTSEGDVSFASGTSTVSGDWANKGDLTIAKGATLTVTGKYTDDGETTINGTATLNGETTVNTNSINIGKEATVTFAKLIVKGTVASAEGANVTVKGEITVDGDLVLSNAAKIDLQGALTVKKGGELILTGKDKDASVTTKDVTIAEGAEATIGAATVNGTLTVDSTSVSLTGEVKATSVVANEVPIVSDTSKAGLTSDDITGDKATETEKNAVYGVSKDTKAIALKIVL